jgi:hypothetical protein
MRLRTHQRAHGAEFKLGAHRRSLLHLLEAHIDDLELRMGDDHAIDAGIAAGFDDRKRFGRRQVSGLDDKLLRGADFQHLAHRRKNLSVSAQYLDAFRCILEMLAMIVGIESGEPDDAAVAALHARHPVDRIGIDSAGRRIQRNPTEYFQAGDVLAREPSAIRLVAT